MVRTLPWLKGTTTAATGSRASKTKSARGAGFGSEEGDRGAGKASSFRKDFNKTPQLALQRSEEPGDSVNLPPASRELCDCPIASSGEFRLGLCWTMYLVYFGYSQRRTTAGSDGSHPPSPSTPPPSENLMIEGVENDDGYRMVEDELLSTAQTFTKNLHQAEYDRMMSRIRMDGGGRIRPLPGDSPADSAIADAQAPSSTATSRGGTGPMAAMDEDTTAVDEENVFASISLKKLLVKPSTKARPLAAVQPHQYTTRPSPRKKQKSQPMNCSEQHREVGSPSFGSGSILGRGSRTVRSKPNTNVLSDDTETETEDDFSNTMSQRAEQTSTGEDDDDDDDYLGVGAPRARTTSTNISQDKPTLSKSRDYKIPLKPSISQTKTSRRAPISSSSDDDDYDDLGYRLSRPQTNLSRSRSVGPRSAELIDTKAPPPEGSDTDSDTSLRESAAKSKQGAQSVSALPEPTRAVSDAVDDVDDDPETIRPRPRIRRPVVKKTNLLDELWDDFDAIDAGLK